MRASYVREVMPARPGLPQLHLLGGPWAGVDGRRQDVPEGSKRLVAYLALKGGRVERRVVAGALWPDAPDARAAGNLRSALWRLRGAGIDVIGSDKTGMWLRVDVVVDVTALCAWAGRLVDGTAVPADLMTDAWRCGPVELLPGWYDEWVVIEQERFRQRLLHGFEALSRLLVRTGRAAEAVEVALTVVGIDPLRESAQRALVEAHLAEGNISEALASYERYSTVLEAELRTHPGDMLRRLVLGAKALAAIPGPRGATSEEVLGAL